MISLANIGTFENPKNPKNPKNPVRQFGANSIATVQVRDLAKPSKQPVPSLGSKFVRILAKRRQGSTRAVMRKREVENQPRYGNKWKPIL